MVYFLYASFYSEKFSLLKMDVLDNEFGVKDSYLDFINKDFLIIALSLIEYVNNEM